MPCPYPAALSDAVDFCCQISRFPQPWPRLQEVLEQRTSSPKKGRSSGIQFARSGADLRLQAPSSRNFHLLLCGLRASLVSRLFPRITRLAPSSAPRLPPPAILSPAQIFPQRGTVLWPRQPGELRLCLAPEQAVISSTKTDPLPPLGRECDPWEHQNGHVFHGKKEKSQPWLSQARPGGHQKARVALPATKRGLAELDKGWGCSSWGFSMIPSQTRLGFGPELENPVLKLWEGRGGWD